MRTRTITNKVLLHESPASVYEYVTTAGNWPSWHPSSLAVRGQTSRPGLVGDTIEEDFEVAGRRGTVVWTVTATDPPRRWVIDGVIVGRTMGGRVSYEVEPLGSGTVFERRFTYPVPLRFLPLEVAFVARRVRKESDDAVRALERVLAARRIQSQSPARTLRADGDLGNDRGTRG